MDQICLNDSCCCKALFPNLNKKLYNRLGYILINACVVITAILFGVIGDEKKFGNESRFDVSMHAASFALTIFYLIIIILSLTGTNVAIPMNNGFWSLKVIIAEGFYFIVFTLFGQGFFKAYTKYSKYISLGYILYLTMISVSFGHFLNVRLWSNVEALENAGLSSAGWQGLLWTLTIIFFGSAIAFYIDIFETTWEARKAASFLFPLFGCIFSIILSVMSISPICERKKLLNSAYVSSFVAYLFWSGLVVNDKKYLNETKDFLDIVFGLTYVLAAVLFLALTSKKLKLERQDDKEMALNPFLENDDGGEVDVTTQLTTDKSGVEHEVYLVTRSFFLFQGFLLFLSIYYSMLFTGWYTYKDDNDKGFGYYCKFFTAYACEALYLWVIIAPRVCPDRTFDF